MFPLSKVLGILVAISGLGYLVDSFGMILVPDYAWTIGMFAFVGEALLILALLWRAVRGFRSPPELVTAAPLSQPAPVA
jgi:membrane protein implicated in regulation of membrane protease activity